MGNRGCLHDEAGALTGRRWTTKSWVTCALEFKGRRRALMAPGQYTELFFLDEPTALAAGHRPCGECRRQAYASFRSAFIHGQAKSGIAVSSTVDMDRIMHRERTGGSRALASLASLPTGAMVEFEGAPWLVAGDELHRWSPEGYGERRLRPNEVVQVLTPPATTAAFAAGYSPTLHASLQS